MKTIKTFQVKIEEDSLYGKNKEYKNSFIGYEYIDGINVFGMEMFLLYSKYYPEKFRYHLAFQREGLMLGNLEQSFSRPKNNNPNIKGMFNSIKPLMDKLSNWIDNYGSVCINSNDIKLKEKWINVLLFSSKMIGINFKIEKEEVIVMSQKVELYLISK
jgi:hypothetical protein